MVPDNFALERHAKGMDIKNAMLWEIKRFYKEEFEIGKTALEIIALKLGVTLPEDEAGNIALHLVNAELILLGVFEEDFDEIRG